QGASPARGEKDARRGLGRTSRYEKGLFHGKESAMVQMKYTILVSALAAASLLAAGCEQRSSSGEKVGQAAPPASRSAPAGSPDSSNKPALMAQNDQAQSGSAQTGSAQSDSTMQKAGKVADDGMITLKVKAALLAEPGLKSSQIDVATKDATVTL